MAIDALGGVKRYDQTVQVEETDLRFERSEDLPWDRSGYEVDFRAVDRRAEDMPPSVAKTTIKSCEALIKRLLKTFGGVGENGPTREQKAKLGSNLRALEKQLESLDKAVRAAGPDAEDDLTKLGATILAFSVEAQDGLDVSPTTAHALGRLRSHPTIGRGALEAFDGIMRTTLQKDAKTARRAGRRDIAAVLDTLKSLFGAEPGEAEAANAELVAVHQAHGNELAAKVTAEQYGVDAPEIDPATSKKFRSLDQIVEVGRKQMPPELANDLRDFSKQRLVMSRTFKEVAAELRQHPAETKIPPDLERRTETARSAYREIEQKHATLVRRMHDFRRTLINDRCELSDRVVDHLTRTPHFAEAISPERRKEIRGEMYDIVALTNGRAALLTSYITGKEDRALANASGYVDVGSGEGPGAIWHELGHQLENSHGELTTAARAFVNKRSDGTISKLNDVTTAKKYDDKERCHGGDFWTPYLGKIYDEGDTEVLSIGLEHFQSPEAMVELFRQDEEHFNFTLGATRS